LVGNRVVVLGGGVGGVAAAVRLAGKFQVTLVSKSDFVYYADIPKLFFEGLDASKAVWPLGRLESAGIKLMRGSVTNIDAANRVVRLAEGERAIEYDQLVVALGANVDAKPHL